MSEIGKLSGQLLEDNLTRAGSDLSFDTNLLYLDVKNRRLGIGNTGPTTDFLISGNVLTDNYIVDTSSTIANFTLSGTTIQNVTGAINLTASGATPVVYASGWQTGTAASPVLDIRTNTIQALSSTTDININPTGTGSTVVNSNALVNGNIHATGNVTFDGSLVFGNDASDTVTFNADIASNIRPDVADLYDLGSSSNLWKSVYTQNATTESLYVGPDFYAGSINLGLRQGKSYYVSVNGNDTNDGNHQSGPFLTISKALSVATSGDSIFIFPGTYAEICPMTIPAGVAVKGLDIRTVIINPTVATRNKDIFLLNGFSTVEDLTISNFEYNAVNNTGYAFRFATGINVTGRSPYIRNITVLTYGSSVRLATNLADDPRGYLAGDAGRLAFVDGSVANSASKEAAMLFHSVTAICPGTDTLVMTNGVRVEWLNSFTYFASRGFYATNGTAGFAGQGTKFGAEIRSIGSAHVYGDWACWGDGDKVIMYLVGHNFAYVGSRYLGNNDPTLADEGHQAERLNGAQIYYQSVDQNGNVRVGNVFQINGTTGVIQFTGTSLQFDQSYLEFNDGTNRTYIDANLLSQGYLSLSGNTLTTFSGKLILNASTNNVVLNSSVNSFITPIGSNASTFNQVGGIRFNTDITNFEGYANTGSLQLYSIQDSTQTTRITPELTPGANDKTIRMYADSDLKVTMNTTLVNFKNLLIGDLSFDQPQVNLKNSSSLTLIAGSDKVYIKNLEFSTNIIQNPVQDNTLDFTFNNGYLIFDANGVVFPAGTNAQRTVTELGTHRYNTEIPQLEVWNGFDWVPAAGSNTVTTEEMIEYSDTWTLVLG